VALCQHFIEVHERVEAIGIQISTHEPYFSPVLPCMHMLVIKKLRQLKYTGLSLRHVVADESCHSRVVPFHKGSIGVKTFGYRW
jgi:hypothetical protein